MINKMPNPIISVVITTYNHEKYIAQAIESVLSQKECPDYEIIIGEDCSTDSTSLIIESFLDKYENIRLLKHNINLGIQQNLKSCFDCCNGKYIAILEGDDYWIDNYKLKKQYDVMSKNQNAVFCFSDINLLFEDGKITEHIKNKQKLFPSIINSREFILYESPAATFSCCMYASQAVRNVPSSFYMNKGADYIFNLYILENGEGLFLKEVCVNHRILSNGQWNGKRRIEKKNSFIKHMCVCNKELNYKYNDYFKSSILNTLGVNNKHLREIFAIKIPLPGKRIFRISIQGGRKKFKSL